jgi:hypothetical protein
VTACGRIGGGVGCLPGPSHPFAAPSVFLSPTHVHTPTRRYAVTPTRRYAETPTRSYLGTLGANSCENACSSHGLAS